MSLAIIAGAQRGIRITHITGILSDIRNWRHANLLEVIIDLDVQYREQ